MNRDRDVRRLQLLVTRAADCAGSHPELHELDTLLRLEGMEMNRLRSVLTALERPADRDREDCGIVRHNIAVELRDLLAAHRAAAR